MRRLFFLFCCLCFLLIHCKKTTQPNASRSRPHAKQSTVPSLTVSNWRIQYYERIRLALADDDLKACQQATQAFHDFLTSQKKRTGSEKITQFEQMIRAISSLLRAKNLETARLAFGVYSKFIFSYLRLHPEEAKGLTAYFCPMAKGFKKWIQVNAEMTNPYMGRKMLKCGGKTSLF